MCEASRCCNLTPDILVLHAAKRVAFKNRGADSVRARPHIPFLLVECALHPAGYAMSCAPISEGTFLEFRDRAETNKRSSWSDLANPHGKAIKFHLPDGNDGNALGSSAKGVAETRPRVDLNQGAAQATIGVSGSTRVQ